MPPPAEKRSGTRPPLPRRRRLALIVCLAWALCLHGGGSGTSLQADAAPARRPGVASGASQFADDKRRIPSCPDALHNR
uniref:Uncharacterized protein n=1 Tax=Oryza brachyantha TaxID=4533 RepID=J3KW28_ORYBR